MAALEHGERGLAAEHRLDRRRPAGAGRARRAGSAAPGWPWRPPPGRRRAAPASGRPGDLPVPVPAWTSRCSPLVARPCRSRRPWPAGRGARRRRGPRRRRRRAARLRTAASAVLHRCRSGGSPATYPPARQSSTRGATDSKPYHRYGFYGMPNVGRVPRSSTASTTVRRTGTTRPAVSPRTTWASGSASPRHAVGLPRPAVGRADPVRPAGPAPRLVDGMFNPPPRTSEVYCDITTPARWEGDTVHIIDLDLDVVRRRADRRWSSCATRTSSTSTGCVSATRTRWSSRRRRQRGGCSARSATDRAVRHRVPEVARAGRLSPGRVSPRAGG